MVCKGSVLDYFENFGLLPLRKDWSAAFPGTKIKYLLPVRPWPLLRNFTEFYEKIHCQFCFLRSFWRHKMSKNTDVFFARAQIT